MPFITRAIEEQLRQLVSAFAAFKDEINAVQEEMEVCEVSVKEEMRAIEAGQEIKKETTCI
ncbi:hypothetical protein X975_10582, partial [Stegodyphus mimosarum]